MSYTGFKGRLLLRPLHILDVGYCSLIEIDGDLENPESWNHCGAVALHKATLICTKCGLVKVNFCDACLGQMMPIFTKLGDFPSIYCTLPFTEHEVMLLISATSRSGGAP